MTLSDIGATPSHLSYYAIMRMLCESQASLGFFWPSGFIYRSTLYNSHTYNLLSFPVRNNIPIRPSEPTPVKINILIPVTLRLFNPLQIGRNPYFPPETDIRWDRQKPKDHSDSPINPLKIPLPLLRREQQLIEKPSIEPPLATKNTKIPLLPLRQLNIQRDTSNLEPDSTIKNAKILLQLLKDPQNKIHQMTLKLLKPLQIVEDLHAPIKSLDKKSMKLDLTLKNVETALPLSKDPQKKGDPVEVTSSKINPDDPLPINKKGDISKILDPSAKISIEKTTSAISKEMASSTPLPVTKASTHHELITLMNQSSHSPLTVVIPFPFAHPISTPLYKTKKGLSHSFKKKQERDKEEEGQSMALVPKGPLIGNDSSLIEIEAFAIAITPVTNAQFANWLNDLADTQQITLNEGVIRNLDGELICYTQEKVATSQIQMTFQEGMLQFKPIRHMEDHPVVHVTYLGANLFCQDRGVRLPTEFEWERAAGMTLPSAGSCKKFLFGCSSDEMAVTLANYQDSFTSLKFADNRTTPVGFYNGETLFSQLYKTLKTKIARSPFGCYDMSGNVGEWVAEQVSKGGSYNSPIEELKISSRVRLDLNGDAFTGFRVALSL